MSLNGPIIIVDDDEDEITLVKSAFKSLQVPNVIISFKNGKETLEYLEKTKDNPFIILSDLIMPVMDGMELCTRINNNPFLKRKSTPFVFRSGSVTYELIQETYQLSVQG
ncbi:MAG: response regulator, partial [Bacteroidia bacterium]